MCLDAEAVLECAPRAAQESRHFVSETLAGWNVDATDPGSVILDDLLLVTSELVTNASKFCSAPIVLRVTAHRSEVVVAVIDDHPEQAAIRAPHESGGRGLALVNALCDAWGQDRLDKTKTVWCRLRVPEGSSLGYGCTLAAS